MKLSKATIYFYSTDSDEDPKNILEETLESRDWVSYALFDVETTEIGTWHDEIAINYSNCDKAEYEKYFNIAHEIIMKMAKKVSIIMETSEYTGIKLEEAKQMVLDKTEYINSSKLLEIFDNQCKVEIEENH